MEPSVLGHLSREPTSCGSSPRIPGNELVQAITREGSSTIEKRTPALWRFSSETSRQQSSASLRVLNGPLTCAEPSTSLWKFIEPNSPPITQKLLPLVIGSSCYSSA